MEKAIIAYFLSDNTVWDENYHDPGRCQLETVKHGFMYPSFPAPSFHRLQKSRERHGYQLELITPLFSESTDQNSNWSNKAAVSSGCQHARRFNLINRLSVWKAIAGKPDTLSHQSSKNFLLSGDALLNAVSTITDKPTINPVGFVAHYGSVSNQHSY